MTEENYNYRTSQTLLRNQFPGKGKLQIPMIPKFKARSDDFDDLLLIGFDKTHIEDQKHLDRMVHFFLYDYRFERVWKHPDNDIEKLSRYRAVLSPDFSMYLEMAPVMQLYNVFRNRWCGAYWASKGIRVIPTVNWGDEASFDFCFDGIEKGSTVAVSTYMASEHDNRQDQKEWFMAGYNEMLHRIEPEKIICYNTPFPEMQGDIVYVDYDLSSWRYMSHEQNKTRKALNAYVIGCSFQDNCGIIDIKGGGSAYGGKWRPNPNKPRDQRLVGNPGDINRDGNTETHIGDDGFADRERHNTDHGYPNMHTNPHDHEITWENNRPNFGDPINYPNGAPEFKKYGGNYMAGKIIHKNTTEQNRFETISDFKWCMRCGGEVEFTWNGMHYGIVRYGLNKKITIYIWNEPDTAQAFDSADDVLEYMLGNDRLRDVITQVTVIDRTV